MERLLKIRYVRKTIFGFQKNCVMSGNFFFVFYEKLTYDILGKILILSHQLGPFRRCSFVVLFKKPARPWLSQRLSGSILL